MKDEEKRKFDTYVRDNFYDIALSSGLNPAILIVKEGIEIVNLRNKGCFYPVYEELMH